MIYPALLTQAQPREGTATFLLTDIESSTRRWESNPAAMRLAMEIHDEVLGHSIESHRGEIVESGREGDSVLAVFARAADAVAAAVAIQRRLPEAQWPEGGALRIRIALHTGEAEVRGGHYYGQALYRCARLLATGSGGQILLSLATRQVAIDDLPRGVTLIDHGEHHLKDLARPEHVFQVADQDSPPDRRPLRSLNVPLSNLPGRLTALVGREGELADLAAALQSSRLVTLTGAGGSGKTRLAVEVAGQVESPDGVWLVELAPLVDPASVAPAIGRILGLVEHPGRGAVESLVEQLGRRRLLLILDNCEHLVAAVAEVAERILQGCPDVRILATSREPLEIAGEVTWRVPPLTDAAALTLLLERARAHLPDLGDDEHTRRSAAQICARLDGLPLALELAAAQVDALSMAEIAARLENRFLLLSRGSRTAPLRQQTLLATVEWSHNLLDEEERILLRRLAAFAATFELARADFVAAGGPLCTANVVPLVARLVRKSLVSVSEGRYRLHETIREFGRERLAEANEAEAVARALAGDVLGRLEATRIGRSAEWLDSVEAVGEDLAASLLWSAASDPGLGLRMAHRAFPFWNLRGHVAEGRQALQGAIAAGSPGSAEAVHCLIDLAALTYLHGGADDALDHLGRALELAATMDDETVLGRALYMSGLVEAAVGQPVRAEAHLEQALPIWQGVADGTMEAEVLHQMGLLAGARGDQMAAETLFRRSLEKRAEAGSADEAHITLTFLAAVRIAAGDIEGARRAIRESIELGSRLGDRRAAWALDVASWIEAAEERPDRAVAIAGAAAKMHSLAGARPPAIWSSLTDSFMGSARQSLGPDAVTAAWDRGSAMTYKEAIALALEPAVVRS